MSKIMRYTAKTTAFMEGDKTEPWILRDNKYRLMPIVHEGENKFFFIDEQSDGHYILAEDLEKYFKE